MERRFVGVDELAVYLDISLNTVYTWVCLKKVPYIKMGRLVKFDLVEIEKWVRQKRIEEIT